MLHGGVKQEYAGRRGIVLLDPPPQHTHTPVPLVGSVAQKRKTDILWILKRKGGTEGQKGRKGQRVLSIH